MANLSSKTLFHFTDKLDNVEDILLNGFKFSLNAEQLANTYNAYFVNEICFCNIPLSMIEEHVDWYGHYAIGLKRSVARTLGATPVFYVHSKSPQIQHSRSIKSLPWYQKFSNFTLYFKNDQGKQYKKKTMKYENKVFYDEKEWRIIKGDFLMEKFKNQIGLYNRLQTLKKDPKYIVGTRLTINIDDIEYIILDKPSDMVAFDVFLSSNFPPKKKMQILPKILYYSQIKRDF